MNSDELQALINSILERGNPKYTTPSGAFLELIRTRAKERKIKLIAEYCKVYFDKYPTTKRFIVTSLPGILVNHYFTVREDLDYEKFIHWSIDIDNCFDSLKENASDPENLMIAVENIVDQANHYEIIE
jgi:RecB family endonuclease NucS